MKKFILPATLVAMMGVGAYFGHATTTPKECLSDLELENAEALADDTEKVIDKITCYSAYIWEPAEKFVYCLTCNEHSGHHTGDKGECSVVRNL